MVNGKIQLDSKNLLTNQETGDINLAGCHMMTNKGKYYTLVLSILIIDQP